MYGWTMDDRTKLIMSSSSKDNSYCNKGKVFQSNMSKNTVDGNCITKNVDGDVKHKPSDRSKKVTNE